MLRLRQNFKAIVQLAKHFQVEYPDDAFALRSMECKIWSECRRLEYSRRFRTRILNSKCLRVGCCKTKLRHDWIDKHRFLLLRFQRTSSTRWFYQSSLQVGCSYRGLQRELRESVADYFQYSKQQYCSFEYQKLWELNNQLIEWSVNKSYLPILVVTSAIPVKGIGARGKLKFVAVRTTAMSLANVNGL